MEEAPLGTVEPVKATSVSLARPDSPPLPVCRLSFALTLPSEFYKVACVRVCVWLEGQERDECFYTACTVGICKPGK